MRAILTKTLNYKQAIQNNSVLQLRLVISHDTKSCKINTNFSHGFLKFTPLTFALKQGDELGNATKYLPNVHIIRHLLKAGANPNQPSEDSWILPLQTACMRIGYGANQDVLRVLIAHGAYINSVSEHTTLSPLQAAIRNKNTTAVRTLLEYPTLNLNARNNLDGSTALHEAVLWGLPGAVTLLLEHGANPKIPDFHKMTPRDDAYLRWQRVRNDPYYSTPEVSNALKVLTCLEEAEKKNK